MNQKIVIPASVMVSDFYIFKEHKITSVKWLLYSRKSSYSRKIKTPSMLSNVSVSKQLRQIESANAFKNLSEAPHLKIGYAMKSNIEIALEYYRLAVRTELSESDGERIATILEIAESNSVLSFLISELDHFLYQQENNLVEHLSSIEDSLNRKSINSKELFWAKPIEAQDFVCFYLATHFASSLGNCLNEDSNVDGSQGNDDLEGSEEIDTSDWSNFVNNNSFLYREAQDYACFYPAIHSASTLWNCLLEEMEQRLLQFSQVTPNQKSEKRGLTLQKKLLIKEYCRLATRLELSNSEAAELEKILTFAQHDDVLSFLINEVDYFIGQELCLLSDEDKWSNKDWTTYLERWVETNEIGEKSEHLENSSDSPLKTTSVSDIGVYRCAIHLKFDLIEERQSLSREHLLEMLINAFCWCTDECLQPEEVHVEAREIPETEASPQIRRQLIRLRNSSSCPESEHKACNK